MIKKLLLLSLVALMALGCDKKEEAGNVTLRFSWWGGDERHGPTLEAIKLYEELNPTIKIKPEYGGWTGHQEKMATQLAGKTAPDVMQINHNWLDVFSANGKGFYDLSKTNIDLSGYDVDLLKLVTVGGSLNMIPYAITGKAFGYNEQAMASRNYAMPTSWDEMFALGKQFGAINDANYVLVGDYEFTYQLMLYYLLQKTGKQYFNEEQRINYTVAELEDGFNFVKRLNDEHVLIPISRVLAMGAIGNVEQFTSWVNGNNLATYDWDSALGKYETTLVTPSKMVVGPYPTLEGAVQQNAALYKISLGLAINANTKYAKESAKFINFMINDPRAIAILGASRGVPANSKALAVLAEKKLRQGIVFEANEKVMANAGEALPTLAEHAKFKSMLNRIFTEFSYGKMSANAAANAFLTEGNAILTEISN